MGAIHAENLKTNFLGNRALFGNVIKVEKNMIQFETLMI